jgi:hypothetical protein
LNQGNGAYYLSPTVIGWEKEYSSFKGNWRKPCCFIIRGHVPSNDYSGKRKIGRVLLLVKALRKTIKPYN